MIRPSHAVWALGFLAASVLATPLTHAQDTKKGGGRGGMGMGMGATGPGLVSVPAVQKELKMTDEQKEKAREFAEEYQAKGREMYSDLEGLDQAERMKKMQTLNQAHMAAGMKDVEKMLKPEQTERFKQIVFQVRGVDSLTDPEIAKELKITPEQTDKVANLMESMRAENRAAMADSGGDRAAAAAKMQKVRKDAMTKALALMTPEQSGKVKAMIGEPFEMPAMGGGGRGNR